MLFDKILFIFDEAILKIHLYSSIQQILKTYYEPSTILGAGDTIQNANHAPCPCEAYILIMPLNLYQSLMILFVTMN